MADDRESKLKIYSLAVVVFDKPRGSDYIKASPMEDLTLSKGLLKDQKYKYDVKLPDAKGVKRADKVEGDNIIVAKWIPISNSNRMSAPDVIEGETVVLYRYADTDEYYWTTIFREPKIRRLETVLYAFGNLIDKLVAWSKKTSYWCEVSTHDKYIHVHTSKSDGEPFEYDIRVDTREGYIEFSDDIGNFIRMDSSSGGITCKANSNIVLDAPQIVLKANIITNDAPVVYNNGDEITHKTSLAQVHQFCSGVPSEPQAKGPVLPTIPKKAKT